jgi:hypothetical protein
MPFPSDNEGARLIAAQTAPREPLERSGATVVSVTVSPQPGIVPRALYERVRTLLVIAIVVVVSLTYAVVELASTNTTTVVHRSTLAVHYFDLSRRFADAVALAEPGARLDHRGEHHALSASRGSLAP